jgi:hypothetical protein
MGGNARGAAVPAKRRVARRACEPLRRRNANTWDEICRVSTSAERAHLDTRQSRPAKFALSNPADSVRCRAGPRRRQIPRRIPQNALRQISQLHLERRERRFRHRASRMNHDVPSRRILRSIAPQNFANAASYAVAYHRAPQRFLHADAEPAARETVRAIENCELRTGTPLAAAIHGLEIRATQQARVPGKPECASGSVFLRSA